MAAGTREKESNTEKEGSLQQSTRKPPYKIKQRVQVKSNWCFICLVTLSSSGWSLTSCVDEAGLELSAIPMPLSPKYWDYRHAIPLKPH